VALRRAAFMPLALLSARVYGASMSPPAARLQRAAPRAHAMPSACGRYARIAHMRHAAQPCCVMLLPLPRARRARCMQLRVARCAFDAQHAQPARH